MNGVQEKLVTDVQTDGRTNGRTDKHEFIGPPLPEVQKQHGSNVNYIKVS